MRVFTRLILVLLIGINGSLTAQLPPVTGTISPTPIELPFLCRGNIVHDGTFNKPLETDWLTAYGTPQIGPTAAGGCNGSTGYASMWGNGIDGEALTQAVSLSANTPYVIEFCGRFRPLSPPSSTFNYVDIVVRASNGVPGMQGTAAYCPAAGCTVAMTASHVQSTGWNTYTACFTPAQSYDHITFHPTNASLAHDPLQVSWAEIDNVCIRPLGHPTISGPSTTCVVPATYCINPPQTVTWSASGANFVAAGANCIQVNQFTSSTPTITATTTTSGCPVTTTLPIKPCPVTQCCGDNSLNASITGPTATNAQNIYGFTAGISGMSNVVNLEATIVSASHTYSTGCGTAGPIAVSFPQNQPATAPWAPPVVPTLNGTSIVWVGSPPVSLPSTLQFNLAFPPGPGPLGCTETITFCIEFDVSAQIPGSSMCRHCKIVRCFSFRRTGGTEKPMPVPTPSPN
jgi:hypothetical protein